jgi:hypothetical protein
MKTRIFGLALAFAVLSAQAQRAPDPAPLPRHHLATPAEQPRPEELRGILGAEPNEAELQTHRHYRAKNGQEVHSPSKSKNGQVPAGASAQCRDGTYSFSQHRRGTCAHHGGVSSWL